MALCGFESLSIKVIILLMMIKKCGKDNFDVKTIT